MKLYFHNYGTLDYINFDEAIDNPLMEFVDEDLDQFGIMRDIVCDCEEDYYWSDNMGEY